MPGSSWIRWSAPTSTRSTASAPPSRSSRKPPAAVRATTETYDYLRLLYSSIGVPHCPVCGNEISRQTTEQILQHVLALKSEERLMVMAPIVRGRKGEYKKDLEKLARQGFVRARI